MKKKQVVPAFETAKEEALWWDNHMEMVEENLITAMRGGTIQSGVAQRLVKEARESKNITIRVPIADIDRARFLAGKKGIGYQTYMKILLHEALERESKKAR